jgi:hypothetical protein
MRNACSLRLRNTGWVDGLPVTGLRR